MDPDGWDAQRRPGQAPDDWPFARATRNTPARPPDAAPRMDYGNRAPRLEAHAIQFHRLKAPPGRPIGLKDADVPRPWTLRRILTTLFLPRR